MCDHEIPDTEFYFAICFPISIDNRFMLCRDAAHRRRHHHHRSATAHVFTQVVLQPQFLAEMMTVNRFDLSLLDRRRQ